jgi:hypothetical protein
MKKGESGGGSKKLTDATIISVITNPTMTTIVNAITMTRTTIKANYRQVNFDER